MNMHAMFRGERDGFVSFDPGQKGGRRNLWMIAVAAAVLLAGLAMFLMRGSGADEAPENAAEAPTVSVVVPGRTPVATVISASGSLSAVRDMPVGVAGEGGMISAVLVDAGDWVGAGQVLARVDRSVQTQQANQLSAQIRAAEADAALAQAELERAQALVSRGFISKADLDRKTATRDAARARVGVAQAQLAEMQARIGRLDIRAPAAGRVLERSVEPGQVVGSGGPALFRIARDGAVEMRAAIAEQNMTRLKVGIPVKVTPVGQTKAFDGSIWLLSPIVDPETRQGEARIRLPSDPALKPGGFATAQVISGSADMPLLPESAVQNDAKGSFVYVVNPDNRVVRRDVTLGMVSNEGIAIASGLSGNEQVVLSAGAFLNPGEKVNPARKAR